MYTSATDRHALERAAYVLLHSGEYDSTPEWLAATNEALKRLHGAPRSSFLLPDSEDLHYLSEDVDPEAIAALRNTIVEVPADGPFVIEDELLRMGHIERRKMGPFTASVDARTSFPGAAPFSTYSLYTDVIVPAKMGFPVGISMPLRQGETVISMLFEHPPPFAEVQKMIQQNRRLLPAFITGIHGYLLVARARRALFATFDAMPVGMVVLNGSGCVVYVNMCWECFLTEEPESDVLHACVGEVASRLLNHSRPRKSDVKDGSPVVPLTHHATRFAHYQVEAFYLPEDHLGGRFVAVHISRRTIGLVASAGRRCGLSQREVQVAVLLIEGKTNPEIANELFLSVHTVRRHVESILKKTKCGTRAGVQQALMAQM